MTTRFNNRGYSNKCVKAAVARALTRSHEELLMTHTHKASNNEKVRFITEYNSDS